MTDQWSQTQLQRMAQLQNAAIEFGAKGDGMNDDTNSLIELQSKRNLAQFRANAELTRMQQMRSMGQAGLAGLGGLAAQLGGIGQPSAQYTTYSEMMKRVHERETTPKTIRQELQNDVDDWLADVNL